jgi:hypothetical protein
LQTQQKFAHKLSRKSSLLKQSCDFEVGNGGDGLAQVLQLAAVAEAQLLVVGLPREPVDLAAHVRAQLLDVAFVGVVDPHKANGLARGRLEHHLPEELRHLDLGDAAVCGQVERLLSAACVGQRGDAVRAGVDHKLLAIARRKPGWK